jgi:hypothetical protein
MRHPYPARRSFGSWSLLLVLLLVSTAVFAQVPPSPVRAIRLDFNNLKNSRTEIAGLEKRMRDARTNLVALGAGRLDWTYFKWPGKEPWWSSDVTDSGIDFLAEDAARFSTWASVSAVIDVLAPRYIAAHPRTAAVSWLGTRNETLVSTTELVNGDYGRQLTDMAEYVAAHYPVSSISLTELDYHIDGYGEDDKASYTASSGRADWPRTGNGLINIEDPSIGEWRSRQIGQFLERIAAVVHRYGKKLFVDVQVDTQHPERESADHGQAYGVMLASADKLVVWDYFGLSGDPPDHAATVAHSLAKYGSEKIIISIGLWAKSGTIISPEDLRIAMKSGLGSEIPSFWITPSRYLSPAHWQVISEAWAGQP